MISRLRVNGRINPLGIEENVKFSFVASEGELFNFKLYDVNSRELYSKVVSLDEAIGFKADYSFERGKKYFWNIDESEKQSFLVSDVLDAPIITPKDEITHPVFLKNFKTENVNNARLVITGLGFYRAFINGIRVGDDYLTPGLNDYDEYVRYQTYDITSLLKNDNKIEVVVGDGMYIGRMGYNGNPGHIFGDSYLLSAMIIIDDNSGKETVIKTDTSWKVHNSEFKFSSIYDGEIRDANIDQSELFDVKISDIKLNLVPQFNETVRVKNLLKPTLFISKNNEQILDFHQNMVGYVKYNCKLPKGQTIHIQFGEILQDGCFFNVNLRSAKQELIYTSNGEEKEIESFFTFYGFRYAKVSGIDKVDPSDFVGCVFHTDLEETLSCTTSNPKINQLIHNTLWGQKGNFVDVPTDCPQRDERLGWTGDSQVFCNTASMNMYTKNFYKKYCKDLRSDQVRYYDGNIPAFSPSLKGFAVTGGAVWSDAATIIPLKIYEAYGDKDLLIEQYPMMKEYVDALIKIDREHCNDSHIIEYGFTYGDWLAQDGFDEHSVRGGTDDTYIKTVYYLNSVEIMIKVCHILGKFIEEKEYVALSKAIRKAIKNEYFSENGRICVDSQTGYILALYYNLIDNKEKLISGLKTRLDKDLYKMKSGFTGTPLALPALFDNGLDEYAFRMLFSEKCPGWLYAINMGATTIWERWNSVLEDGTMSGDGMNSLNHYAYGSVCEAIYTRIVGFKNLGNAYKEVEIKPHIDYRLKNMDLKYNSIRGDYEVKYVIDENNVFNIDITVPHGCKAYVTIPYTENTDTITVEEGTHSFSYTLLKDFNHPFSRHTCFFDILQNEEAAEAVKKAHPLIYSVGTSEALRLTQTPYDVSTFRYLHLSAKESEGIDEALRKIKV